jgi:twitching motility two-component system response regulator PilH
MKKIKVMVVDDSPTDRKLMSEPFLSPEFDLVTATDGEEALKKAQTEKPDLVILDVIMPKLNGFKVCRHIKKSEKLKNIKIILLTSKNQESDKFWGEKQGADAYMVKPFTGEHLMTVASRLML